VVGLEQKGPKMLDHEAEMRGATMLDDRQLAPERPVHPRTGVGGGARRRQVVADHVGNGGRGRSEQSERSPLRDKLPATKTLDHEAKRNGGVEHSETVLGGGSHSSM
jgi:hypothetical protein